MHLVSAGVWTFLLHEYSHFREAVLASNRLASNLAMVQWYPNPCGGSRHFRDLAPLGAGH